MLWEVEIRPKENLVDREATRILAESRALGADSLQSVQTARSFLIETDAGQADIERAADGLLADLVVENYSIHELTAESASKSETNGSRLINVLLQPGVTDNVANSARVALQELGISTDAVATCRKYWVNSDTTADDVDRVANKALANDAIEQILYGPLALDSIALGNDYDFDLLTVAIRTMDDGELTVLSRDGQLYLNLTEMQTIKQHFVELDRDPTDAELETVAQTWSEHCSHKTLAGRIRYRDGEQERSFENMLKETIFEATMEIRRRLGDDDWCISVFKDNAGIVKFNDEQAVCIKVETHNHPSALEPYGGANTGIGGVIRDPLGTGLGARPVCNTDVFCFAPPETPYDSLPPGTLHPKVVAKAVVAGVRDYGNRMGIPTVNGAVYFDERYLGNPLVYCGNVAMIPVDKCEKNQQPGDLIVAIGGRTGRDGIHGATFSSSELTEESETLSGGAVQIGNAITEKMVADVLLAARDRGLYSSITDCGAGGFSSAVGEMGEEMGAEVWLDRCPLKYSGLSYTEIWISEAQERMVLAVPPANWDELHALCEAEGVEATIIGEFQQTGRLVLKYGDSKVADLSMQFLHDGRPPVIREAIYEPVPATPLSAASGGSKPPGTSESSPASSNQPVHTGGSPRFDDDIKRILASLNVCSKEWIIRQYDHEVQSGSVVKPLVGVQNDGPSDAAVIRPELNSTRGLAVACGMNPRYGDFDPYWMAASAIDEAVRNCVAVGADPDQIAILDNFCWGNTDRPEVLGSLVRASLACYDVAVAFGTPFVSGKDSLNNEFSYDDADGQRQTVAIPPSLLITALGQLDDVARAVTMDLKEPGNAVYLVGTTHDEMGGSHYALVNDLEGGEVPRVDLDAAPAVFRAVHSWINRGLIRSCHDLSEGGLAIAAAEMAFAGGLGLELDLGVATQNPDDIALLFSESNTRFLVEVVAEKQADFEASLPSTDDGQFPVTKLGTVTENGQLQIIGTTGETIVDADINELKAVWQKPLAWN
ncbi:MAG: phosphoribosylformylglycinamidine synthase subunit PurL [Planctomycetaceae bacterium]|jgi:phosphoribosylformylglycinamidine synthase subunit PurSL|nr:phosphoribosylformylglycinamidine synthase subunit PurL [Planctomycetaceae bacterium]MBT6484279.1 phosphoribosylformylglycinamidine synthase subunit PurL [Planctomycetaceae bacterium]MBT6497454.1 phosphoribosylformylglycinamidine synthase subunit PurL [Planctomycetaceae bacterium]